MYTIKASSGTTSGVNKREMAESIRTHVGTVNTQLYDDSKSYF